MYLKLKDRNGNVFRSFVNDNHKPAIVINDTEYEVYEFSNASDDNDSLTPADITELDSDSEIREMIEQSKTDIEKGNVFSTQQMKAMIRSGEI